MTDSLLKRGERAVIYSAMTSFLLIVIKLAGGFVSNSAVLLSDSLDSISDFVSMLASWVGLRIAQRKPSKRFPYGYYKAESIASLFASALILYGAFELVKMGYARLLAPFSSYSLIAILSALSSSVISFILYLYLSRVGKSINSQLLLSTSKERFGDSLKSIIVLIAIVGNSFSIPFIEGITTIAISIYVLKFGLVSLKDSIYSLMDMSPEPDVEKKIRNILRSNKNIKEFYGLRLRKSGPFVFGEVNIKVSKSANIHNAHIITELVEKAIKKDVPTLNSFVIHVEPFLPSRKRIAIPIDSSGALSSHLGRAPFFMLYDVNKRKIEKQRRIKNPFASKKLRAGMSVAKFLSDKKIDALITNEIGEISFNFLRNAMIEIYRASKKDAKEVVMDFLSHRLEEMTEPTKSKE